MNIPFNKPYMTGKELWYIVQAHSNGHLAGDGQFTKRCSAWLEARTGASKALLTHSCTAALEMVAILTDLPHAAPTPSGLDLVPHRRPEQFLADRFCA